MVTVAEQMKRIPSAVRPTVQAARRTVKAIAPRAKEIAYQSEPRRAKCALWKIVRYATRNEPVVGIGTFPTYATLYFYRGRDIDDASGLLEGSGKDMRFTRLRTPADAGRPDVRRLVRQAFALEND
jgi:hypothetical protein